MMIFDDKTLQCRDCGADFTFSAGEQEFFHLKGLVNEPKRCPNCRLVARAQRADQASIISEVNCAQCGMLTKVPFQPKGHRPVYCAACFQSNKPKQSGEEGTDNPPDSL